MQSLRDKSVTTLLLVIALGMASASPLVAKAEPGPLILIGDVLRHNQYDIWKRVSDLAEGGLADFVVLSAANPRPELYGGFAVRALQRYGAFVELMPIEVETDESGIEIRRAANDPVKIERLRDANAVFFVGGAPQRLASVLFNTDRSITPLAEAIRELHANGGLIIGGIPAQVGVSTDIDSFEALRQGRYADQDFYQGLGLLGDDWYVDQHFFKAGRFAQTLIAMNQLNKTYALGIGANTAAIIIGNQLEVVGDGGVMFVDLSNATSTIDNNGFSIKGVRLSYLDQGDRLDMVSRQVTAHALKLEEFEVSPKATVKQVRNQKFVIEDVFSRGSLLKLIVTALEGEQDQVEGIAMSTETGQQEGGFVFRFYTAPDSIGWVSYLLGDERWTVLNIYLDISPLANTQEGRSL